MMQFGASGPFLKNTFLRFYNTISLSLQNLLHPSSIFSVSLFTFFYNQKPRTEKN